MSRESRISKLHNDSHLWTRLKIFTADLLHKHEIERLVVAPFYLSNIYFTDNEVEILLSFPTTDGRTLQDCLEEMFEKKKSRGICSSHDLAPLFQTIFHIPKHFEKEKKFKTEYKNFIVIGREKIMLKDNLYL